MSIHETTIAFQWLYATLNGDSTLAGYAPGGVWRSMAPPGTATPFVVMALQSGTDVLTMNAFRVIVNELFQVKVVGPASASAAITNAAARLDTLLKLASGTVTGGAVLACYRQSPLSIDEIINGELFFNQGGLYRLLVEQTS